MPFLDDWKVISYPSSAYQAPELWPTKLTGKVYGHPGFVDGTVVYTSQVQELDLKASTAKTAYSKYFLLDPNKEWLVWLEENGKSLQDYKEEQKDG